MQKFIPTYIINMILSLFEKDRRMPYSTRASLLEHASNYEINGLVWWSIFTTGNLMCGASKVRPIGVRLGLWPGRRADARVAGEKRIASAFQQLKYCMARWQDQQKRRNRRLRILLPEPRVSTLSAFAFLEPRVAIHRDDLDSSKNVDRRCYVRASVVCTVQLVRGWSVKNRAHEHAGTRAPGRLLIDTNSTDCSSRTTFLLRVATGQIIRL